MRRRMARGGQRPRRHSVTQLSCVAARCAWAEFLRHTITTGVGSEPTATGKMAVEWALCSAAEWAQQVSSSVWATTDRL